MNATDLSKLVVTQRKDRERERERESKSIQAEEKIIYPMK